MPISVGNPSAAGMWASGCHRVEGVRLRFGDLSSTTFTRQKAIFHIATVRLPGLAMFRVGVEDVAPPKRIITSIPGPNVGMDAEVVLAGSRCLVLVIAGEHVNLLLYTSVKQA